MINQVWKGGGTASTSLTAGSPNPRSHCVKPGLGLNRLPVPVLDGLRRRRPTSASRAHRCNGAAGETVQRGVLDAGARPLRRAPDGKKRQVDACASNMGQCLGHGIVNEGKVPQVAERLMSPEIFTAWGRQPITVAAACPSCSAVSAATRYPSACRTPRPAPPRPGQPPHRSGW